MHSWLDEEAPALKILFSCSGAPYGYLRRGLVADLPEEIVCGWKPVRPCAQYDCTRTGRRRRGAAAPSPLLQQAVPHNSDFPYMSGQLDENFSYVYKGGLSRRGTGEQPPPPGHAFPRSPVHPACHTQTIVLDPPIPYRSSQMEPTARTELAKIVALQLKPELLVEQIIIENRLRTMSLNAFPMLEVKGVEGRSRTRAVECRMPTQSYSSPALVSQHCKHRKRKPKLKPSLEWCALAGKDQDFAVALQPFDNRTGVSGSRVDHRCLGEEDSPGAVRYGLPVVAPLLEEQHHAGRTGKPKKLNPLMYQPVHSGDNKSCIKHPSF